MVIWICNSRCFIVWRLVVRRVTPLTIGSMHLIIMILNTICSSPHARHFFDIDLLRLRQAHIRRKETTTTRSTTRLL
jgi:hypothetical protein